MRPSNSGSAARATATGAESIVEAIRAESVGTVFGLIGSAMMELYDALYDAGDVRLIPVRDERTGTHMADAFARISGKPGIMIAAQNGPGATNLVTGVAQAFRAYSPVVTLAGAIATSHANRDGFQEIDQQALFAPITKRTWTATRADALGYLMEEAFRVALSPRTGPVHLNVPRDVLPDRVESAPRPDPARYRTTARAQGDHQAIRDAAGLLGRAARPVIVAGGGIKTGGRHREAVLLAEVLHSPIAASAGHGDAVPSDHDLFAGQIGPRGNAVATRLVQQADVVLALGTRLGFNSTFFSPDYLNPAAALIHVEIDPTAIGRHVPVELAIVGDAAAVAGEIAAALEGHQPPPERTAWTAEFRAERDVLWRSRDEQARSASPGTIHPTQVFRALRRAMPRTTIVTLDAGTACLQATDQLRYYAPPSLVTPLDFGLVGFSFAAGLGAKLAEPGRPVVSLIGDGGFGLSLIELSTAVAEGIPTTVVVLNNHCWGAEKAYQRDFFDQRYIGSDLLNPPFDAIARSFGARGLRVDDPDQLEDALGEAVDPDVCTVVDVQIDPDALVSFRRDSFAHRRADASA